MRKSREQEKLREKSRHNKRKRRAERASRKTRGLRRGRGRERSAERETLRHYDGNGVQRRWTVAAAKKNEELQRAGTGIGVYPSEERDKLSRPLCADYGQRTREDWSGKIPKSRVMLLPCAAQLDAPFLASQAATPSLSPEPFCSRRVNAEATDYARNLRRA